MRGSSNKKFMDRRQTKSDANSSLERSSDALNKQVSNCVCETQMPSNLFFSYHYRAVGIPDLNEIGQRLIRNHNNHCGYVAILEGYICSPPNAHI